MHKGDLLYLGHMLDMAKKAVEKTKGINRKGYDSDENLRLALTHLMQSSAKRRGGSLPKRSVTIPRYHGLILSACETLSCIVVHDYFQVDEDIIWDVVTEDLQPLVAALERIVPPE